MLRPFVLSVALEGLLPRFRPPRRPPAVVWEDRIHARRGETALHEVTGVLSRHAAPPAGPGAAIAQCPQPSTSTATVQTVWTVALAVRRA